MDRKTKGIEGEAIAKRHYENIGCEVLEENYRFGRAEIDLIAMESERLLIFIEVKRRSRRDFGEPETFVSESQQQRIKEAAEHYIFAINWKKDVRFDIVCIDGNGKTEVFQDAF
ncbi:YraN family protein [Ekhidna sp. To15]|uniref:YraN family protein n=1 Tax=Ekhidna sp. To15 TaxID=3395267 RepID=UPI003F51EB03